VLFKTATYNRFTRIADFFSKRLVLNILFLVSFLGVLMIQEEYKYGFSFTLITEVINVIFYAIIIYLNLWVLIPKFLSQKKTLTYIALLVFAVLLITPIKVVVFYFLFGLFTENQDEILNKRELFFVSSFFIAIASTFWSIIMDWWKHQKEKKILETRNMQSELNFLKSQINPHFLFNTLNSLYAHTLKKSDDAPEIVLKLSEMMRYMLYECNERQVSLSKELNYMKNYIDLERLRQGKKVNIKMEIEGEVEDQLIAPLLFIPFIENCFKHGLNHHLNQGYIDIKIIVFDDTVNFYIKNSKPIHKPKQLHPNSGGIGLVNVKRRLELIYPNNYELDIDESPTTYTVSLDIELN